MVESSTKRSEWPADELSRFTEVRIGATWVTTEGTPHMTMEQQSLKIDTSGERNTVR